MKIETIICELNPIHLGHVHIIECARRNSDITAAVMSGNFTQRCEPAVFDKYTRAHAAVLAGCDIVFELPYPWCCAGAEGFALGGAAVAHGILSDGLCFGSESGDISYLTKIADIKSSPEFKPAAANAEALSRELGSAAIFDSVLRSFGITDMPSANDKLGAEYIRFGREAGIKNFTCVKRIDEKSAGELRRLMYSGSFEVCESHMPSEAYSFLGENRHSLCGTEKYAEILFAHSRLYTTAAAGQVLQIAAKKSRAAVSASEFMQSLSTKKYTSARFRRELLYSITGVSADDIKSPPPYTILLAANDKGRRYLSENRRKFPLTILTKPSPKKIPLPHLTADELYCLLTHRPPTHFPKQKPAII